MKKVMIAIGILVLICFALASGPVRRGFNRLVGSYESHERQAIQNFLSQ